MVARRAVAPPVTLPGNRKDSHFMTTSLARFPLRGLLRQVALTACVVLAGFSAARAQVIADDFHACAVDSAWTFVDPLGDGGSASITGGYTGDAHLALSVPGGVEHEAWAGAVNAPHLSRPLADADFTTTVKFASELPAGWAQEGLFIREGASQWLRLELYRGVAGDHHIAAIGSPTTVFYDQFVEPNTQLPFYMRVTRTGDSWTVEWSNDGVTWIAAGPAFTFAFHPDRLGIYAGNRGPTPPAHTVLVDWIGTDGSGDDIERNTLATSVSGSGLVTRGPDLANYACGQTVTLTAVEQPGWAFSGWSGAATGMQNPIAVTMNGPGAVLATFAPVPVDTLVTAVTGGGSISLSPPGGVYNRGTVVTVTAVDGPGWAFDAFTGDLTGSVNPQTITMNGNRAVTAAFTAVAQYTVTANVDPASSGTVTLTPAGGTYNAGRKVVVRATPAPGWAFTGWSGNLSGASSPDSLIVDGDKVVTALFTALPLRTLVTTVNGAGTIVRTPDQAQYFDGTKVVLAAVPDAGWRFTGWGGDLAGTATPDSLVMNADHAVAATFEVIPPVIASDDFNRCDLGAAWTVVDPYADGGTAQMTGGYTNDAGVAISVPGGFEHEIWAGYIGATHILQPSPDVDFTIEAKFDADLPVNFAQEGIVIKESEARWVRAEFFRDDFNRLRVAVDRGPDILTHDVYLPEGLTAPLWMRVTRTGDTWVQSWSSDGVTWNVANAPFTYDMTVTAAGLFAGNRGSAPPAHTVVVDYIRNTAGAPVGEDATRAPLTVTVDGTGVVNRTLDLPSYGCGQVETLTAVGQPGWAFSSWSGAVTGTQNPIAVTMSGPATVVAHFTALPQYALSVGTASGQGSVQLSPAGGLYYEGTPVVVTAVPDFGWSFSGWGGDLTGIANPDTLVMTGARSVTASFVQLPTPNFVSIAAPVGQSLSSVTSCLDSIAVRLDRLESDPIHSFSLGLKLTNLALCSGAASVREGGYLGAHGSVSFVVTQTSDSTLTVDGTLLSGPCGAGEPAGVLAWLDVSALISDGTGTVTVTSVQLRGCDDLPRIVEATGPGTVTIDSTPPAPATGLTAATLMSGNAAGSLTAINVAWTAVPALDVQSIEVWRKGFGAQPEFSDGGGAVPAIPAAGTDPASVGWQLAGVLGGSAAGLLDHPATRDFWYYHVRTVDAAGNRAVTPTLAVALDYLLADVAGGVGNAGDDMVGGADVAAFSGTYGSLDGQPSYRNGCDVGPTADASPFSLPATDNRIDFEDLMILSLSHGLDAVGGASSLASSPAPAGGNALMLTPDTLPGVGSTFPVTIVMAGDGTVQGLSIPLTWDNAVVTPVAAVSGALLSGQGGSSLVFMPQPGLIDVALLGLRERGISGAGALAVVTFEVVGTGQPRFGVGAVIARDRGNAAASVVVNGVSETPDLPVAPTLTVLHQNKPNPFNPRTTVSFDLARAGQVRLMVYGIDGRVARVLVDGSLPVGSHAFTWDGTDEGGRRLASGVYLVRLVTPEGVRDIRMTMLK
jgi:regulation of enolase protein 1 (concanavalin A-like superfamily)